ncbi:c-type cytochrome [Alcaligenaceae bacterium]|nr:c-type cytochrome [Alcaligenaceae bacterium]
MSNSRRYASTIDRFAFTLPLLLAVVPAQAEMLELAKTKLCLACHSVDTKLVGPAFKDIAAKEAGTPDVIERLAGSIRSGSSGVWGPIPMPPNGTVSEAEAKTLAEWILSLK